MAASSDIEYCYEGSDEASENEYLDQSLSLWKGFSELQTEEFVPIPLDLHTAASIGQYDCVRNIIQKGEEDINRKNKGGWTPLMYACYIGHDTIVHLLLEAEVNLNIKNNKGQTPLMLAACCGNESVAYFLLQAGAELESRDKKGWTALFHATYSGHQNMVRFLLENGANAESTEPRLKYTPFMEAAAAGHEIIVQCFLQHGVNVNAKAYSGDTARTLALMNAHIKIVSLIENHLAGSSLRLRADPGLNFDGDLSSSDEQYQHPRKHNPRHKMRSRGPSIREGPEALSKMIDQSRMPPPPSDNLSSSTGAVPKGYMAFPTRGRDSTPSSQSDLCDRDVTSPINNRDLDSSGSRESHESGDYEEDLNAFTKTGALTIKSSSCSSSSGGLAAALGLSRTNSLDSTEELAASGGYTHQLDTQRPPRPSSDPGQRSAVGYLDEAQRPASAKPPPGRESRKVTMNDDPVLIPSMSQHLQQQQQQQQMQQHNQQQQQMKQHKHQQQQQQQLLQQKQKEQLHQQHLQHQQLIQQLQQQPQKPFTLFPESSDQSWSLFSHNDARQTESQVSKPPPPPPETVVPVPTPPRKQQPPDLATLLNDLGLTKYYQVFLEQDVDLQVFLSLTDIDLKEIGIKLFGPRRKMTNAIARWHSETWSVTDPLEKVYADRLEAEMQEMAIQLHQAYEQVETLKQQVLQERELRSVTESCLMEERRMWQHVQRLAVDTRQRCLHCQQTLGYTRLLQEELCRRLGTRPELSHSWSSDSLTYALKESLSLEGNTADRTNFQDFHRLSNQDILRKLLRCREEVHSSITITLLNSDKLLGRDVEFPQKRIDKFS